MQDYKPMSPMQLALLQAGGAILANNGPNSNMARALGRGAQGFGQGYVAGHAMNQRAQSMKQKNELRNLIMQQKQAEAERAAQQRAVQDRMNQSIQSGEALAGLSDEQRAGLQPLIAAGDFGAVRDALKTFATREPDKPDMFERFMDPAQRAAVEAYKNLGGSRSTVNVNMPSIEPEFLKAQGKGFGSRIVEDFSAAQDSVKSGRSRLQNYKTLDSLLGESGGAFEEEKTKAMKAAKAIGLDFGEDIGQREAAVSLGNKIALELRNPAGGAGMPGAMSDADREYLKSIPPSIAMTPEGRELLIEAEAKVLERSEDVAKVYRDNFQRNGGRVTIDVYDEIAKLGQKRLFDDAAPAAGAATQGGAIPEDIKSILDKY